jgi:hypothetical protein
LRWLRTGGEDRYQGRAHQRQRSTHLHLAAELQRAVESRRAWAETPRSNSAAPRSHAG